MYAVANGLDSFQNQYSRTELPVLIPEGIHRDSSEVKSFTFGVFESDNLHYFRPLISATGLEIASHKVVIGVVHHNA